MEPGEARAARGVGDPQLVVHGKAAVLPSEERRAQALGDRTCSDEVLEHSLVEALGEELLGHRGAGHEGAVGEERAIGGEDMQVGVEVGQVAEGLHEEDEARWRPRSGRSSLGSVKTYWRWGTGSRICSSTHSP